MYGMMDKSVKFEATANMFDVGKAMDAAECNEEIARMFK
jgi:hypothetical protein